MSITIERIDEFKNKAEDLILECKAPVQEVNESKKDDEPLHNGSSYYYSYEYPKSVVLRNSTSKYVHGSIIASLPLNDGLRLE